MTDDLRSTLEQLSSPGAPHNAAFDTLLSDYARFHLALSVLSAGVVVVLSWSTIRAWKHLRAGRHECEEPGALERATFTVGGIGGLVVAFAAGLIAAANLSTALRPLEGFRASIPLITNPPVDAQQASLYDEFNHWLRSGTPTLPPMVRHAVQDRLSWQRPKAVICAALLVLVILWSRRLWRAVLHQSREGTSLKGARQIARVLIAVGLVPTGFLLTLMVMGNTQASIAPLAMTLFYR